jgi:membrane-bound serine protease (ClpP class)
VRFIMGLDVAPLSLSRRWRGADHNELVARWPAGRSVARIASETMELPGPLLAALANPDVTYLLLLVGITGLVAEFHHPGTLAPGIVGALALLLALVGFTETGVNWLGLALIALATCLFVAEAHAARYGALALGGILSFVAGSWLLFETPSGSHVSLWLIALGALALSGYFLVALRAVLRARRLPYRTGVEALRGRDGVAITDLAPSGSVRIAGEDWSAIADVGPIKAGEVVEVLWAEGLTLRVHRPYEWRSVAEASAQ